MQKSQYEKFKQEAENLLNDEEKIGKLILEEYDKLKEDQDRHKMVDAKGKATLNHKPCKLNYWHFTIDMYPMDNSTDPIKKTSAAWEKLMAENWGEILRRTFVIIPKEHCPVEIKGFENLISKN